MRLGLSLLAAREFTGNGIMTINRLRTLTEDSLDRLIKQIHRDNQGAGLFIPFASQQHIHAIRFWANRMHIIGAPYDVDDIDEPLAEMWSESKKAEQEAARTVTDLVKIPEAFKKESKWRVWKESVVTYLHSKIGQASIPLAYIVRERDLAPPNQVYNTVHEQLVNMAILYGPEYNTNNGVVYDLLQSLTLNGPAWSWISGYQQNRDGRGAWKALIAYYEGDAMQTRSKQECYDAISKSSYQGVKRNFDFSAYVAIHQQAHQDLVRLGEPIPENKKVRDFLQGITDPQCGNIKLNVLSNPIFMNNFAQTINYMASAIDMISKNSASTARQISHVSRNESGRGRGRSGRGRANRGGRNNNRGGRGRGRAHGGRENIDDLNDNRPITRAYSRDEWQSMSHSQRNRVFRERDRMETARTVAAILREEGPQNDDVSTITGTAFQGTNGGVTQSSQTASVSGNTRSIGQVSLDNVGQAFSNRRRLNAITSGTRKVNRSLGSFGSIPQAREEILHCRAELDSHADTCGINHIARVLEISGQVAEVSGFSNAMDSLQDIPIVKAAVAYDHPETGEVIILVINQALYFGDKLTHILLNPNQLRSHNIRVDDVPKHLSSTSTHSIWVEEESLDIPMVLHGIISYFNVRTPTLQEINNCPHITLTSEEEWNPYSGHFKELEDEINTSISAFKISAMSVEYSERSDDLMANLSNEDQKLNVSLTNVKSKRLFIQDQDLAIKWGIGVKDAENTVKATTQRFIRSAVHPVERRFRTKNVALRYNHLNCRFNSDTFFSNVKSSQLNTCGQLFITDFGYAKFVPMRTKAEAGYALKELIQDVGIPKEIHTDGAKELTIGTWKQICRDAGIKTSMTEKDSPWQNRAEVEIRELKRHTRRFMSQSASPLALWDFCCLYTVELRNRICRPLAKLKGRTPYEVLTGNTPDISEYLEFSWYQPVWFYEPDVYPQQNKQIARWLGIAHRVGQAMCYWILPISGVPIARTTIQEISKIELESEEVCRLLNAYDLEVNDKLGAPIDNDIYNSANSFRLYREDEDSSYLEDEQELFDPEAAAIIIDEIDNDAYDELLLTEPLLQRDGQLIKAKITGRKRDGNGNPIGQFNRNPILNSRIYLAEFPDGHVQEISANVIAEAIYNQIDDKGHNEQIIHDIIGHRFDSTALTRSELQQMQEARFTSNGKRFCTLQGWEICVSWTDSSTSWHSLSDIKNSFPVQLAKYAKRNGLDQEPAFKWWVQHTIKKEKRIIKAIKSRYSQRTHKFGIYVPRSVQEALKIDRETGTTFWKDAIEKEMSNNKLAFKFLNEDESVPVAYKWIRCHMIFDVKMDFTRKACYVAGGHMTDPPSSITYSSVVSRDSVRIAFLLAALNDVDLLSTDIGNAYLNALPREKVYTTAGPEFGPELQGKSVLIVRALYGLKSSGAAWRSHLANTLQSLGYVSCVADPDVWYRPAVKPDGFPYYEYVLVYVDDLLVLSHQGHKTMKALEEFYRLKDGYASPSRYLGAEVKQWKFSQDITKTKWALSSAQYVKEAIKNIEEHLSKQNRRLYPAKQPMHTEYRPELDITPYLDDEEANFYMSQVSILRWMIELGRLDIYVQVALLSSYLVQPRQGHLEAIYYMFGYLKAHDRSTMVFDSDYINWRDEDFPEHDWTDFYGDISEDIPPGAPEPRGMPVQINAFIDASHARNMVTRRSHSGILIYLNRAPIIWHSKAQKTVETSTFGAEFVALKIGTELIKSLRYKLRMMGVPLEGPANVLVDNDSVVKNSTIPTSIIQKKHNSICYHFVREAVASKCIRIAFIPSSENLADMLTKPMGATKLKDFCERVLY